ncbi:alcohol dehydrogenase [Fusarium oxysporum f. sp. conglutinans]|nr:alcohol dehydrogenase [Fusarium oxysporum f. sp. conglutinans]
MVRRNYTEDDVAEAILDTTGRGLSQNEAAQKRGVPQSTLSGRLSGQASRNERIQAHQRIPKSQGETLIRWVLRQESLGYALSHSQVRACVEAILQQQGDNKPLGKYWTTRFVKRHLELSTKLGKRQEAARFDGFTPKAVNWYFDIRENEYGWIKPENTVNVDEGGIMVGFGLDSLVIGSSDPKKKAMLKGVQSRTWTSFIEAVTATGRALKPGIIFKGKELQKQWFLNEFELIADWHYITSPNGWTDNHIALEWLKDVYLPQTEPRDASDARLIILDGHGSHAQDEWMATCFLNNVYCCYLPAHCSHGLQPLDNGIFNVIKGAYRKELQKLASLTDSAPDDKVHFIRAYAKAREAGMRKDIILSGWRFTGNWPINRHKALTHPEIQPDKEKVPERFKTPSPPQLHSDDTPKTSRQVRDLAKHRSRPTRRKYSKMAKGLEALEMKVAVQNARITGLEEQMAQVRRGKKRKAVPDPNRRFMALAETLTAGEALPDSKKAEIEVDVDEKVESVIEVGVSGSEIRALSGWGPYNPIVGHEGVGTVVKLGKGVDAGLLNKRVGVKWLYSACGTCTICKRGYPNNCPKQLNTGKHVPGTLQEYMIADTRYVTEIPDELPGEVAAPLLCAGLTMAGAVSKLKGYAEKGDWVVISGSGGGLGHLGVQIASRLNGLRVIAVDTGEPRRKLSLGSGAEHFIDFLTENVEERVKEITGEGASAVLVVTGSQEAFIQAPSLVRNMGIIVTIGLPRNDFNLPLSATICSARSLTVTGVAVGTEEQMKDLLQHALDGTIVPEVKVLEFEEVSDVVGALKRQEITGRVVVKVP